VQQRLRCVIKGQTFDTQCLDTTSATNPGDSGGPMVNDRVELVAVVSGGEAEQRLVSHNIDLPEVRSFLERYSKGSADTPPPVSRTNTDEPEPKGAKRGYVTGRVLRTDGKPIDVPGARIVLEISGFGINAGNTLSYLPQIQRDGSYQQRVSEGTYHFTRWSIEVPFDGKTFQLQLEPVGDARSDRESEPGIVQDFVWKTQGLWPGKGGYENTFTNCYGGSIHVKMDTWRNDLRKSVPPLPAGTKCEFTVTPQGKLIDGTDGKEMKFLRDFSAKPGTIESSTYLNDIPVGVYTLKPSRSRRTARGNRC